LTDDIKIQIWQQNLFWKFRKKNQNWREEILAIEKKNHFWRMLADF